MYTPSNVEALRDLTERLSKVKGEFTDVSGAVTIAEEPSASSVEVTIGAASFNSRDDGRDAHIRSAEAALAILRECVQMHGAMGFTHDCDIGLYLKRALVLAAWLGNPAAHRRRPR